MPLHTWLPVVSMPMLAAVAPAPILPPLFTVTAVLPSTVSPSRRVPAVTVVGPV